MKLKKRTLIYVSLIVILGLFIFNISEGRTSNVKDAIQYFPINNDISFIDLGSNLEIYENGDEYILVADNWSKTNKKVFLRQDVNLLFQNNRLKVIHYPWKENTDWIVDKMRIDLAPNSIYSTLSYHHAEIHEDNRITSQHAITEDYLYTLLFQDKMEAFKEPDNARQEDTIEQLKNELKNDRDKLLSKAIKELNINKDNYFIYNLNQISAETLENKEFWPSISGRLWEGIYRFYVLGFSSEELEYFSPPMPWIFIDKNGTHLLVIYQQIDNHFVKLIQQI